VKLLARVPSEELVRRFISAQENSDFSYAEVGATRDLPPAGYNIDHNRVELGRGAATWERAKTAVRAWKMFDHPLARVYWDNTPLQPGNTVAMLARHLGFYSLDACRIVYCIDEPSRFGFAYGTLAQHAERGEERFSVEWDLQTDVVTYDLFAFSRPRASLARIAAPYSRQLQYHFAKLSKAAMVKACR
jgi:uncharacterized protein (UPF0548 family)